MLFSRVRDSELPALVRWVWAAGCALALVLLLALGGLAWLEHKESQQNLTARAALLARVLEDQATRSVESAGIALGALAGLIATEGDNHVGGRSAALLGQAMSGLPLLRSVALVDARGLVLSSTAPQDTGLTVDLAALGPPPPPGQTQIGAPVAGRSLAALDRVNPSPAAPRGLAFIPLLRTLRIANDQPLMLVGLLNPDQLSNYQETTLRDEAPGSRALLARYDGQLLAASADVKLSPGAPLTGHAVWQQGLTRLEHAALVAPGSTGAPQVIAFRASRSQPLVAVVELPLAALRARWWESMTWPLVFASVGVGLVLALTWLAARALRARASARRLLDEAQARVVHSERELSVLVKSVQNLLFRTDPNGVISFVNLRWAALSGDAPERAIGLRLPDIVELADVARVASLFDPARDSGVRQLAAVALRLGAQRRWFDIAVVPLRAAGQLIGFAGSAADVTDRWRAEQRLQAELAFSTLLLESSPLPMAVCDIEGQLSTVNQAWEDFTGLPRARMLNRPGLDHLPQPERGDQGQPWIHGRRRFDARMRHADGGWRDVAVTQVAVAGARNRCAGTLTVLMDVSEYREAERATREARDSAEEASRAKSEFIANISHELRTPLQSIIGFSELGQVRGRAHERLAGMFGDIHAAGQRMLALVNDLLDVAKIESTVGTLHLERTELRMLVQGVARELEPLLHTRQLRLDLALGGLPLPARVDPLRVQQVFRNVLANAIRFAPPSSAIQVEARCDESGAAEFRIRDRGPGIPPSELESIFEAFVQSSRTKDGSGGTGLGLAICRKILNLHGGEIAAENAAGGGAVFTIRLPLRQSAETLPAVLA